MSVTGQRVIYRAPSLVGREPEPVVIRCVAVASGPMRETVPPVTHTVTAEESFTVTGIINDVAALCPGVGYEFTATVVGDRPVVGYEWTAGEEGSIRGSTTSMHAVYLTPTSVPFCIFGSISVAVTVDNGDGTQSVLNDTETFIIPPLSLALTNWTIVPDNKPIGLYMAVVGLEEVDEADVNYAWVTDAGTITGTGARVQFTHPTVSEDTLVEVSCTVTTEGLTCEAKQDESLIVVHAEDVGVDKLPERTYPDPPVIEKGPTNDLTPIPPIPPVPPPRPFPQPPLIPPPPKPPFIPLIPPCLLYTSPSPRDS